MRQLRRWVAVTAAVCALGFAGCDDNAVPVIGFAFPDYGAVSVRVVRQELYDLGIDIEIAYDSVTHSDRDPAALDLANRFATDERIVGVVGHAASRNTLVAAPVYEEAGIPLIVPSATSRRLAEAGDWIFTLVPNDSIEGDFIAAYVSHTLHAAAVSIFAVADEYGAGLSAGVRVGLAVRGIEVLDNASVRSSNARGRDFANLVRASLLRGVPDVVVIATRDRAARGIISAAAATNPGLHFVAGDGVVELPELRRIIPPNIASVSVVSFWDETSTNPASLEFIRRFHAIAGRDPTTAEALRHEALILMARAVDASGGSRHSVRRYLRSLGAGRPPAEGVIGPISFGDGGPANRLTMIRVETGSF